MIDQLALFDYAALDSEMRYRLQQRAIRINAREETVAQHIIENGRDFAEARDELRHNKAGGFERWIDAHGWSRRTAYRYIRAYMAFGNCATVAQLPAQVIHLLSEPDVPDEAREQIATLAEEGYSITPAMTRGIIHDHKEPAAPYPDEEDFLTAYEEQIAEAEYSRQDTQRRQQISVITGSSESNEWYTPAHIIGLARSVLGDIDFDPATSEEANKVVNAPSYCTLTEDGFAQPWLGRVWLNPPYGKEEGERETNAVRWSRKLIAEHEAGRVEAAILLVKAALGYNWFEELWRLYPTCLLRERLSFVRSDGSDDGQAKHATALLYFGSDVARFQSIFRPFGRVILPE